MYEGPGFRETRIESGLERHRYAAGSVLAISPLVTHMVFTRLSTRGVNSAFGFTTLPFSSTGGSIVKTVRIFAMASHKMSWAKYRPAQIRRPNPNVSMG